MKSKTKHLSEQGDGQPQVPLEELPAAEMPEASRNALLTDILMSPLFRNGNLTACAGSRLFGEHKFSLTETADRLASTCRSVQLGNLAEQKSILACQATALDALFTEMAERALSNFEQYPEAADRYMRLALKAQGNCRVTIEALDKMARQGTQIIKHIHVDNRGGKTVITDAVSTGGGDAKSEKQSHATGQNFPSDTALLGQNSEGNGVQLPSRHGEKALQDARWD